MCACKRTYVCTYIWRYNYTIVYVRTNTHTYMEFIRYGGKVYCGPMRHHNDYKTTLSIEYTCLGDYKYVSAKYVAEVAIHGGKYTHAHLCNKIIFFFRNLMLTYLHGWACSYFIQMERRDVSLVPMPDFRIFWCTKHVRLVTDCLAGAIPAHQLLLNRFPEGVESQIR